MLTDMPGSVTSIASEESTTSSRRPKNYVCDFEGCDKAYSRPALLEQHRRSHTGERPFKCPYNGCDKSFLRKSHLMAHEVSHQNQQDKPHHCSVCGKGVNTIQHLRRHEITHTKSFKCTYDNCEESFYKHQSLRHHISLTHEKTLTCKVCNKTFSRPNKLANHNIKYHSETPTYQCDFKGCFKNFKTWSALQLHIKTDHPKLKCPVCDKGCVGKQGLQSHMVSHNAEFATKLWNCEYCEIGKFVKKNDLITHYNEFHDGNVPESFLKQEEQEKLNSLQENSSPFDLKYLDSAPVADESSDFPSAASEKSLRSLNNVLDSQNVSVIDLLLKNYNNKTIECPKPKCNRKFSREYDLKRHLLWHEQHATKISKYLDSLKAEDYDEYQGVSDNEVSKMIDDELKLISNNS